MKKHLVSAILALVLCLSALSGCSLVGVFEKDVNVVFENNGTYVTSVTVNTFNNAIAPVFDEEAEGAVPDGYKFMGWSAKTDWQYGDDREALITSGGIVRYNAVKNFVNEGGTAIARPVIIDKTTIPKADLVIAWYDKEKTSGLNQGHIDEFEVRLREFLTAEGYQLEGMEIVIRAYAGNVGPSCEAIRTDGDVDIMIGWSDLNNLTGTGGMTAGKDILANCGGISIGDKERYSALLIDSEISNKVYEWVLSTYGNGTQPEEVKPAEPKPDPVPDPAPNPDPNPNPDPTPDPAPSEKQTLVIGWWTNSKSGLNSTIIGNVKAGVETYLNGQGYTNVEISLQEYDQGAVADVADAVTAAGNVNIMLGMKAFAVDCEAIENVQMGTVTGRRIHLVKANSNTLSALVFEWFKTADAQALFVV